MQMALPNGRHGVVGVLVENDRFLVIRRSRWVRAPRLLCFPGGGIEMGEDFETAIRRELLEELELEVHVERHLWSSRTSWGTDLEWMLVEREPAATVKPNQSEVEEVMWLTQLELIAKPDLLGSVPEFFAALEAKKFEI